MRVNYLIHGLSKYLFLDVSFLTFFFFFPLFLFDADTGYSETMGRAFKVMFVNKREVVNNETISNETLYKHPLLHLHHQGGGVGIFQQYLAQEFTYVI